MSPPPLPISCVTLQRQSSLSDPQFLVCDTKSMFQDWATLKFKSRSGWEVPLGCLLQSEMPLVCTCSHTQFSSIFLWWCLNGSFYIFAYIQVGFPCSLTHFIREINYFSVKLLFNRDDMLKNTVYFELHFSVFIVCQNFIFLQ